LQAALGQALERHGPTLIQIDQQQWYAGTSPQ